jgi:acetyl-CoA synthetase
MIKARIRPENPDANMKSYYQTYRKFCWSEIESEFPDLAQGKTNIVYHAVDKWAAQESKRDRTALIFEKDGSERRFTYLDLKRESSRWGELMLRHGFKSGDRLLIYLDPCPEIYFAMLGCARIGVIFSILYPTLNFDELEWRLQNSEPRGILTNLDLAENLPPEAAKQIKCVFLTSGPVLGLFPWEVEVESILQRMETDLQPETFPGETPLYLLYSSGSTGPPKGVVHAHRDMVGQLMTARYVLDLNDDSILWTDGNPAWVTGTVYGAFAPWLCGATSVIQSDPFSASTWYRTIEKHRVTVWYTTPMTIRRLAEAGSDLPGRYDFSNLKHIATVGETLVPELFFWLRQNLKHSAHDTWWMTETGMICMANFASEQVKPGSMGKPVPGVEAAVIDPAGVTLPILTLGQLVLKAGWPAMMQGIWRDEKRFQQYFWDGWFLTGDMVLKDEDGYYYHQGRNDDLIKTGEEFIGPYDLERVICLHPAVAEAAVISKTPAGGKPAVKAFISLKQGLTPSARLNQEIKAFVRTNLHAQVTLTEIDFLDELPKTRSGKMLRRVLRASELGLPSGDLSKLKD